jgi:hypothetical protein
MEKARLAKGRKMDTAKEKVQRATGREMGTVEEKGKEQLTLPVRKKAGKRANVNC